MNRWIQDWRTSIVCSLKAAGIEAGEAETEAEFILSHSLGISRSQLYFYEPGIKSEETGERIKEILRRRQQREPLQHILGNWEFYGYEVEVNRDVLVPRPETEGLVELVSEWISRQNQVPAGTSDLLGIDWGTGSGCISIALCMRHPSIRIMAIDISERALETAAKNIHRHGLDSRVQLLHGNGLKSLSFDRVPDFIVSNPPYIPERDIIELSPEVRDYDPHLALSGGDDGLDPYRQIGEELGGLPGLPGLLAFEIGRDQGAAMMKIFTSYANHYSMEVRQDLCGRDRYWVMERS